MRSTHESDTPNSASPVGLNGWERVLSRNASRLWQWLRAAQVKYLTLAELAGAIGASRFKTKQAILELEEHGVLTVREVEAM